MYFTYLCRLHVELVSRSTDFDTHSNAIWLLPFPLPREIELHYIYSKDCRPTLPPTSRASLPEPSEPSEGLERD